jgi:phenylacetic acid degradation operon negative regulatory protein
MATALGDDAASAQRPRSARAAGRVVVALLGDYWYLSTEFVPSSALVVLAGELGLSEAATRAALSRLCRGGALEGAQSGRTTAYRLSPDRREAARRAGRELMRFGSEDVTWDGRWTCVAFSTRGGDGRRRALRRTLRGLGLGPLFPEVWISPVVALDAVREAVAVLDAGDVAVFTANEEALANGADLRSAWDLDHLRARYDDLLGSLATLRERIDRGSLGAAEAFIARADVLGRWREVVAADPRLPDELLPGDWPRRTARRAFVEAYDGLGPLAELRVLQLVGDRVPEAARPRHHRVDDD